MCIHYKRLLNEEDRHYINSPEDENCVLCLVNRRGAMTQEEIAGYFNVSKMRISQLQHRAEQKLQLSLDKNKIREWLYE